MGVPPISRTPSHIPTGFRPPASEWWSETFGGWGKRMKRGRNVTKFQNWGDHWGGRMAGGIRRREGFLREMWLTGGVQGGFVVVQGGSVVAQRAPAVVQRGSVVAQCGCATVQRVSVEVQRGSATAQRDSVEAQRGSATAQNGSVEAQRESATAQTGAATPQRGSAVVQNLAAFVQNLFAAWMLDAAERQNFTIVEQAGPIRSQESEDGKRRTA